MRDLTPHLDEGDAVRAIGFALQAMLALHAVSAGGHSASRREAHSPEIERLAGDRDELRYRAACSLDEHAIKFVAACLREDEIESAPVFRLAAADAAMAWLREHVIH